MVQLDLSEFEAKTLFVFLSAHIVPTPTHLRGPIPEIIDRIEGLLLALKEQAGK